MLPQASARLPCAGWVAGWGGWHRGSGTLWQPSEDLGRAPGAARLAALHCQGAADPGCLAAPSHAWATAHR